MEHLMLGQSSIMPYEGNGKQTSLFAKQHVRNMNARPDGKEICEKLKVMRRMLAEANNISYESKECYSKQCCAGTCKACDMELEYLQEQLMLIPKEQRVYPLVEIEANTNAGANKLDITTHFYVMGEI